MPPFGPDAFTLDVAAQQHRDAARAHTAKIADAMRARGFDPQALCDKLDPHLLAIAAAPSKFAVRIAAPDVLEVLQRARLGARYVATGRFRWATRLSKLRGAQHLVVVALEEGDAARIVLLALPDVFDVFEGRST